MHIRCWPLLLIAILGGLTGCGSGNADERAEEKDKVPQPAVLTPTPAEKNSVEALKAALGIKPTDTRRRFAEDDGKVVAVHLDDLPIKSIAPLKGLPLRELRLNRTDVSDLSPIEGMPLEFLNLEKTPVTDLKPVASLKSLKILWLNKSSVSDLSPLKEATPESLDLTGTKVTDLSPLSGMKSLRRLNLEDCAVTDLTPLKGLALQRLVFDPKKIRKGLDAVRNMQTLSAMHTYFPENPPPNFFLRPQQFWALFDAGNLPRR